MTAKRTATISTFSGRKDYGWAIAAYAAGQNCAEIARSAGVAPRTIWLSLKRRGVVFRPRGWQGGPLAIAGSIIRGHVMVSVGTRRVGKHRLLMGVTDPSLDVHHKDGDGTNNALDNLQVMTHSAHARLSALARNRQR